MFDLFQSCWVLWVGDTDSAKSILLAHLRSWIQAHILLKKVTRSNATNKPMLSAVMCYILPSSLIDLKEEKCIHFHERSLSRGKYISKRIIIIMVNIMVTCQCWKDTWEDQIILPRKHEQQGLLNQGKLSSALWIWEHATRYTQGIIGKEEMISFLDKDMNSVFISMGWYSWSL